MHASFFAEWGKERAYEALAKDEFIETLLVACISYFDTRTYLGLVHFPWNGRLDGSIWNLRFILYYTLISGTVPSLIPCQTNEALCNMKWGAYWPLAFVLEFGTEYGVF